MTFRTTFAKGLLLSVLASGFAAPAFAQHVVTDSEAGKLTLDALTATPVAIFHRAVYRPTHFAYARQSTSFYRHGTRAVSTVAWHPGTHAVLARAVAHRKIRRS